jgi:hypothetical protein
MAKNLTLLNMRDMLALITDAGLQRKFIKLYAPTADDDIDWNGLESLADIPRAEMIESAVNRLNATVERKKQYDELFAQLRAVALANADDDNFAAIHESIADYAELHDWFESQGFKNLNAAMLAVIVNLAARGAFVNVPRVAVSQADALWKVIVCRSDDELKSLKISQAVQFVPKEISQEKLRAGLEEFKKYLKLHIRNHFKQSDFYVGIDVVPTEYYTRYVVSTSPLPHKVNVVNDAKTDTDLKDDTHTKTFEVVVDNLHSRIHVTQTTLIGWSLLIDMFLRIVLDTKQCSRQSLSYKKCLQVFRSKNALANLDLPENAVTAGAKCWIDSLELRLDEKLLPVKFHGGELTDVYDQIAKQIKEDRFPSAKWVVTGADLKVRLPVTNHRTGELGDASQGAEEKTFTVKVREGSYSIPGINKVRDQNQLSILNSLQDRWGFQGLNKGQAALGTVQGDFMSGLAEKTEGGAL